MKICFGFPWTLNTIWKIVQDVHQTPSQAAFTISSSKIWTVGSSGNYKYYTIISRYWKNVREKYGKSTHLEINKFKVIVSAFKSLGIAFWPLIADEII